MHQATSQEYLEVKELSVTDGSGSDAFGSVVAIYNESAVVGAPQHQISKGAVYIFSKDIGGMDNWGLEKKLMAPISEIGDRFGTSLDIEGNIVLVGSDLYDGIWNDMGSAYLFARDQGGFGNWGLLKQLTADSPNPSEWFGHSVDLAQDHVIVGAYNWEFMQDTGSAYIFARDFGGIGNWGQVKKLEAFDGEIEDRYGISVAINGSFAAVGADGDDNATGSVYLYQNGGNQWGFLKKIIAPDADSIQGFGSEVVLSDLILAIGAPGDNNFKGINKGAVYIYYKDMGGENNWGFVKKVVSSTGTSSGGAFGVGLSIDGTSIVAGEAADDQNGLRSGSAYVFSQNIPSNDEWGQIRKITTADGKQHDNFGISADVSGDHLIFGRLSFINAQDTGSAYIFKQHIPLDYQGINKLSGVQGESASYCTPGILESVQSIDGEQTIAIYNGNSSTLLPDFSISQGAQLIIKTKQ